MCLHRTCCQVEGLVQGQDSQGNYRLRFLVRGRSGSYSGVGIVLGMHAIEARACAVYGARGSAGQKGLKPVQTVRNAMNRCFRACA